jgi:putative membrane protein
MHRKKALKGVTHSMNRTTIYLLALIAMFTFACKNESNTNNTASTDTSSTYNTSSSTTATSATDTSATTSTTGTTATTAVTSTAPLSKSDEDFAKKAAAGGMMEVDLGQLAASKATSQDVKDFANRMVTDHGKAGDELKSLASQKGLTLPSTPSAEETKTSNDLSKKTGAAFDKAYMSDMVKGHEQVAKDFEKASKSLKDPDLKNWVTKTLPTVQDHLKSAKEINSKLK